MRGAELTFWIVVMVVFVAAMGGVGTCMLTRYN